MHSWWLLLLASAPVAGGMQRDCIDAHHAAVDFWLGEWHVEDTDGAIVGKSSVTRTLDGCLIREEWDSGQLSGSSITAYDAASGNWQQLWVDNTGTVLHMIGVVRDDALILNGSRKGRDGKLRQYRMSLARQGAGVFQSLEASEDEGSTWTPVFQGTYRRAR